MTTETPTRSRTQRRRRKSASSLAGNPFPGARPFNENEHALFRGREMESAELAALLVAQQLVLLYAPSGAGKSSLINASVLRRLRYQPGSEDGTTPSSGVFDVIGVAKVHPGAVRGAGGWPGPKKVRNIYVTAAIQSLIGKRESGSTALDEYLASLPRKTDEFGDVLPQLLVLDQFEEILEPYGRDDWLECRDDFMVQLGRALVADPTLHVLISIREDHLATIERLSAVLPAALDARYRLDKLTREAALEAIEQPASGSEIPFGADLTERLVHDLARRRVAGFDELLPDEFIEPGQLQVVCNRLWRRAAKAGIAMVESGHLDEIGGVEGALGNHYNEAVLTVTHRPKQERRLRRFFERQLVTGHGTRQLVPYEPGSKTTFKVPNEQLRRLQDEFSLLRVELRGGTRYWELTHDGFVEPIRTMNRKVWDRRRELRFNVVVGIVTVAGLLLAVFASTRSSDETFETNEVEQFSAPLDPSKLAPEVEIGIGPRDAGTGIVVELLPPEGLEADFVLEASDGDVIESGPREGSLASYQLPADDDYFVVVSEMSRVGPTRTPAALVVSVRGNTTLIILPDVLGTPSEEANVALTDAGLTVSTIRTVCVDSATALPGNTVIRVLELDLASSDQGSARTLADIEQPGATRPLVATGTTVLIEASSGEACVAVPRG